MKLAHGTLLMLTLLLCRLTVAQEENATYTLGVNGGYGFIIPHNTVMLYITNQHIQKQEVFFEKNTYGKRKWHQRYGFPSLGLSLTHFNLNNPRHLGNATALAPYLSFQLNKSDFWKLKLKTALGTGYLTKRFQSDNNFKNTAIGSRLNLFFAVSLGAEFKLHPKFDLLLAANFSHFSNTGFSKPNLGINLPIMEAGMKYHFGKKQSIKTIEEEKYKRKSAIWQLTTGFGINAVYPPDGIKYVASSLSFGREKRLNYKSTVGGAVDFYYNPAQIAALKRKDIYIDKGWDNLQFGLSIYHLLHFGSFGVLTKAGYYLKTRNKELGNFYHLVGGRVAVKRNFNFFFGLKTHFAKAEYLMLGLNYQFKP